VFQWNTKTAIYFFFSAVLRALIFRRTPVSDVYDVLSDKPDILSALQHVCCE